MPSKNVSSDEWTEIVGTSFEDDYSVVVEDAGILLAIGDKPTRPVAGLPLSKNAIYSAGVDRGERVYARSQTDVDATVRVVPGVRIDGSNERAVSVTASVSTDTYERGGDFDTSGDDSFPIEIAPAETIQELLLPIVDGEVSVEVTTTDGDEITLPVAGNATIDTYSAVSMVISDPSGNATRVAGGWAGE